MRITESQATKMGMTKNAEGNWVKTKLGGSNRGMAAARGFLRNNGRSKHSPAELRSSIIASAVTLGMSEAEATAFYELGRRGH